jgi:hypothetical protein
MIAALKLHVIQEALSSSQLDVIDKVTEHK